MSYIYCNQNYDINYYFYLFYIILIINILFILYKLYFILFKNQRYIDNQNYIVKNLIKSYSYHLIKLLLNHNFLDKHFNTKYETDIITIKHMYDLIDDFINYNKNSDLNISEDFHYHWEQKFSYSHSNNIQFSGILGTFYYNNIIWLQKKIGIIYKNSFHDNYIKKLKSIIYLLEITNSNTYENNKN